MSSQKVLFVRCVSGWPMLAYIGNDVGRQITRYGWDMNDHHGKNMLPKQSGFWIWEGEISYPGQDGGAPIESKWEGIFRPATYSDMLRFELAPPAERDYQLAQAYQAAVRKSDEAQAEMRTERAAESQCLLSEVAADAPAEIWALRWLRGKHAGKLQPPLDGGGFIAWPTRDGAEQGLNNFCDVEAVRVK